MKTFEFKKLPFFLCAKAFIILILFSTACKTKKLDINEPYKDITIVYGLLNPAEPIQYIKINKAFLGDGSAYDYAQQPDSINYNPADLEVSLSAYQYNKTTEQYNFKETFFLKDTIIYAVDNGGIFTKKNNIVWITHKKLITNGGLYKLLVKNKITGKETTGETKLIYLGESSENLYQLNVQGRSANNLAFFDLNGKSRTITVQSFRGANVQLSNSNLFNLKMVINYIEYPTQNLSDSGVTKSFEYEFQQLKTEDLTIGFKLDGSTLLSFLKTKQTSIFSDATKSRKMRNIYFTLFAASPDFTTYLEVNAPRASYLLDKPIYTDINNGYGLFANRFNTTSSAYKFDSSSLKTFNDSLTANISKN